MLGVTSAEYDDMTPFELNMLVEDWATREKSMQEERLSLAYMTAYWQRVKKLDSLKKILGKQNAIENKKPQTDEDLFEMVKALNRKFGGKEV